MILEWFFNGNGWFSGFSIGNILSLIFFNLVIDIGIVNKVVYVR